VYTSKNYKSRKDRQSLKRAIAKSSLAIGSKSNKNKKKSITSSKSSLATKEYLS